MALSRDKVFSLRMTEEERERLNDLVKLCFGEPAEHGDKTNLVNHLIGQMVYAMKGNGYLVLGKHTFKIERVNND